MSHTPTSRGQGKPGEAIREIVFDAAAISRRVQQLARQIEADYSGRSLLLVGILKGAALFLSDLVRHLSFPVEIDFLSISRYSLDSGGGEVRIVRDLEHDIQGKEVLLVEDIVDTGLTLHYLIQSLLRRRPASLAVCTLLERPELRLAEIPIRYAGFRVSRDFLVGYGLDYRDRYRDLPYIATLKLKPSHLSAKPVVSRG